MYPIASPYKDSCYDVPKNENSFAVAKVVGRKKRLFPPHIKSDDVVASSIGTSNALPLFLSSWNLEKLFASYSMR